eukprot:1689414-Rhodomonas_salina.2
MSDDLPRAGASLSPASLRPCQWQHRTGHRDRHSTVTRQPRRDRDGGSRVDSEVMNWDSTDRGSG